MVKEKKEPVKMPDLPISQSYNSQTLNQPFQVGDLVAVVNQNYHVHRVYKGYTGYIVQILDNGETIKVIFGTDILSHKQKKFSRTGVFLINKNDLMRCFVEPVDDLTR